MRYFLDKEFVEDGETIKILSLAIVCEDGRELYVETLLALRAMLRPGEFDPWLQQNVIPHLGKSGRSVVDREQMKRAILDFMPPSEEPEIWGYYSDYDWVAFCQIFGRMIDLPEGYPMYCRDIKQLADEMRMDLSEHVPQQDEHNALADARWVRDAWHFLAAPN